MRFFLLAIIMPLSFVMASCKRGGTGIDGETDPLTDPQLNLPWGGLMDSPWPTFLHDEQHTGRSPYRGPQKGQVEWTFEAQDYIYSSPVIGTDGTVYFQALDQYLYAVSPSGSENWRFNLEGISEAMTTLGSDGTVYACPSVAGTFFALSPSGAEKWRYQTGGKAPYSAPLLVPARVRTRAIFMPSITMDL